MSGVVGFYGKLPGAGDFVGRRLPSDFVDRWDRQFQHAVETGRRELSEAWPEAWRHGVPWRFVLAPQVCGNSAWCGVIAPSVDRLGRAFPMVLAAPGAGDVSPILGHATWFDALERVFRRAQHEAVSIEDFDSEVAALPHPLSAAPGLHERLSGLPWDSGQWRLELPTDAVAGAMLAEMWKQLAMQPEPWCLWWREGAASVLATRGLPSSYAALLDAPALRRLKACDETATIQPVSLIDDASAETFVSEASGAAVWLDNNRALLLTANDDPHDARCVAARGIREAIAACAPDSASQRAALTSLHARLRGASDTARSAIAENGAAIVARFAGTSARFLRVGAAALWHWRRGQLQPEFVERAAGAGGEFNDLLFGDAWLDMPGIGTANAPDYEEVSITLEPGDRLLLLVTRDLLHVPRDCIAEALALPTCDDAQIHLAARAGLGTQSALWPLAVVEIHA